MVLGFKVWGWRLYLFSFFSFSLARASSIGECNLLTDYDKDNSRNKIHPTDSIRRPASHSLRRAISLDITTQIEGLVAASGQPESRQRSYRDPTKQARNPRNSTHQNSNILVKPPKAQTLNPKSHSTKPAGPARLWLTPIIAPVCLLLGFGFRVKGRDKVSG